MAFTAINEIKCRFPKYRIVVLTNSALNDSEIKDFSFELLPERFSTGSDDDPFDKALGVQDDIIAQKVRNIMMQTAFALDVSGYMLSSVWGETSCLEFLRRIYAARHFGYDLYLLSQSFGPFEFENAQIYTDIKNLMKQLLIYPKMIYAREDAGFNWIKKYCANNLKRVDDIVLWHRDFSYRNIWKNDYAPRRFCVRDNSVALIPNVRLDTHGVGYSKTSHLYLLVAKTILSLGYNVYLITHSDEDFGICESVKNSIGSENLIYIKESLNCIEYELLINQFEFAVVSRFHGAVHAYRENVPCVIIGWALKYAALAEIFNQGRYVADIRQDAFEETAVKAIKEMSNAYKTERKLIESLKTSKRKNIFCELLGVQIPFDCTGCGACEAVCSAVSIKEDDNGFRKAVIDIKICVNCGKCEDVCHLRRVRKNNNTADNFFAARHKDNEIRKRVSSGGVSFALCADIVRNGGIAYGAVQNDDLSIEHRRVAIESKCEEFCGSKYQQSSLEGIYEKVKTDLSSGKNIVFTGVGCQIAGLYSFLRHDYDNLLTCEVVCHGIPSALAFRKFIAELENAYNSKVKYVDYRDKSLGWNKNQIAVYFENGEIIREQSVISAFHRGYLAGYYNNDRCHRCDTANLPRIADISLADFWQYDGKLNDDNTGVSLVVCNTQKGLEYFNRLNGQVEFELVEKELAIRSCRHLTSPPKDSPARELFFELLLKAGFSDSLFACDNYSNFRIIRKNERVLMFAKLAAKGIACYYINRPDIKNNWNYSAEERRRMDCGLSFTKMAEDRQKYNSDLKKILKDKYSAEYIEQLCVIPPIIQKGLKYVHADSASKLINIVNGNRITVNQPETVKSIHIYGRCGVFGYAVCDDDTFPSALQRLINNDAADYKVINHGVWGSNDELVFGNLDYDINSGVIIPGDVVIVYMWAIPEMDLIEELGAHIFDTTDIFHNSMGGDYFYDKPGHMTGEGYEIIARIAYDLLKITGYSPKRYNETELRLALIADKLATHGKNEFFNKQISEFIQETIDLLPKDIQSFGAIVMNCNPFTLGHRYLIETAAKEVPHLIVFVVQEDKSVFKFADRFELVKKGVSDLSDVTVVPGGEFIISTMTFPEYFLKDQIKEVNFSPAHDVEIFGKYIAPVLNITVRFAGTEPIDKITAEYNKCMREILPLYGVKLKEIERKTVDGEIVSASIVRKMFMASQWELLAQLVPKFTLEFLKGIENL